MLGRRSYNKSCPKSNIRKSVIAAGRAGPGSRASPMLDAFKSLSGNKGKIVEKQATELELLIATAREERSAISAMLTALTTRSSKLTPLTKSLEQVTDKAAGVMSRLDEIASRLTSLDDR